MENTTNSTSNTNCNQNKKHSKFRTWGGIILVIAIVAGIAGACNEGCKFNPDRIKKMISWKVDDVLDDIDASDSQIERVNQIKENLFKEGEAMIKKCMADHENMLAEWKSETPDKDKIRAYVDNHLEAKRQMAYKLVDASMELHDILTPEQRAQLIEEVEDHMDKCHSVFKD